MRGLNIGLDFDDTFTRDPDLWRVFIKLCAERGHNVFITTARHVSDIDEVEKALPGVEVVPSGGKPKKWACDQTGLNIDIWIDDMPHIIME